MQEITAAQTELVAGAARLVQLAMGPEMRTKTQASDSPHYYGSEDYPQRFDGFHAAIDWGYAKATDPRPIECNRVILGYLADKVNRGEVLMPAEMPPPDEGAQPGEAGGRPWMGLTPGGAQALIEYDSDAEDDR